MPHPQSVPRLEEAILMWAATSAGEVLPLYSLWASKWPQQQSRTLPGETCFVCSSPSSYKHLIYSNLPADLSPLAPMYLASEWFGRSCWQQWALPETMSPSSPLPQPDMLRPALTTLVLKRGLEVLAEQEFTVPSIHDRIDVSRTD